MNSTKKHNNMNDPADSLVQGNMPRRSRLRMKWRLLAVVTVALIVGFSVEGYLRVSEGYETRRIFLMERAELAIDTLAKTIKTPLWYLNSQSVERAIESAVNLKDVKRIILIGSDGLNVIRENTESGSITNASSFQSITRQIYWEEPVDQGEVKKVFLADLTMEISLSQAESYLRDAIWQTLVTNIALTMLLVGVFSYFMNRFTQPLEVLVGYLRYIGKTHDVDDIRDLSVPYQEEENEVGQLSRSLERMRLHSLELLDLRGNLERKVSEQTRELMLARDAAEAASEAKSNFLANVTHELRTPMNAVMGMASLLKDTSLEKKQQEYVDLIESSGDALLVLIGDLIDMAQLEKKQLALQEEPFQVEEITSGINQNFAESLSASKNSLKLRNDVASDEWFKGDLRRIKQVLYALISNAIKFTQDGTVSVSVNLDKDAGARWCAILVVKDTGIGIAPEHQKTLFENFTQVEGNLTRRFAGMGTGLALVSALVDLMDGRISVESELGEGSEFRVYLPLMPTTAPSDSNQKIVEEEEKSEKTERSLNVLVAEDNPVNQMLLLKILEQAGHTVVTAMNGRDAVNAVEATVYDIVLMDIQMPEMDGLTAHRLIRAMDGVRSKIPVVAVTANTLVQDRARYEAEGFDGFVGKPVNPKALLTTMDQLCNPKDKQDVMPSYSTSSPDPDLAAASSTAAAQVAEEPETEKSDTPEAVTIESDVVDATPSQLKELEDALSSPLLDEAQWVETASAIGEETLITLMAEVPDELDKYCVSIKETYETGDLEKLKRESHAMKGLAANSALSRLARVAGLISTYSGNGEQVPEVFVTELVPVAVESNKSLLEKMETK